MLVYLEVVDGPLNGRRTIIRPPSMLTIGRTGNADFVIPDDQLMSSLHLRLECDQNTCRLHDLNSTNGTLVNGQPVQQYSLAHGDRIFAGETTFRIHIEGASPTAEPPVDKAGPGSIAETKTVFSPAPLTTDPPQQPHLPDVPDQAETEKDVGSQPVVGALLEITAGKHVGRKIWVRKTQSVRIGSAESADQAIDGDRRLSATHFAVEFGQAGWQIRDLKSANGTYVNDQRVTLAALDDGDRILAGATAFVARLGDDDIQGMESPTLPFEAALSADEDPNVRREALYAALWTRQPWLLDHCRQQAAEPGPQNIDEIELLAILGTSSDLPLIRKIGATVELGETRFEIVGSYGHPKLMDDILTGIDSEDPVTAESAASAFTRITGLEVEYVGGDDGALFDSKKTKAQWEAVKSSYAAGTRWNRGHDLTQGVSDEMYSQLDMQARREHRLRCRYEGTWRGSLADLERSSFSCR